MGHSILAKRSMVDGPAPVLSWKSHGRHLRIGSVKKPVEAQFFRRESQQPGSDSSHKLFAGAVHNAQFLLLIKSKDGNINLHQHFFQERCGFQCADLLHLQPVSQRIKFVGQFGQRIILIAASHPE